MTETEDNLREAVKELCQAAEENSIDLKAKAREVQDKYAVELFQ